MHLALGPAQGMKALFCTADLLTPGTGGGHVTSNELEALKSTGEAVAIDGSLISPDAYGLPDSPFLADYLALGLVKPLIGDGVSLAHFYSGTFSLTVDALKRAGVPVTYTCPAHARQDTIQEFANLGLGYPYAHIKDDRLWPLFIRGALGADVTIAPSHLSAGFLEREGARRIEVIPHGCLLPQTVTSIPRDRFRLLYLGQTGPDKGLVYALQAWGRLAYKDSTFILAGAGTEGLGHFIRQVSSSGSYQLAGHVADTSEAFNRCTVYVQPSVCEAFGITALEAMAHGRPVIVSEGAGVSELVTEGVDGFVVPRRDPLAIAERVDFLKKNPARTIEMGRKARLKAENFSWGRIREQYVRLWRSL